MYVFFTVAALRGAEASPMMTLATPPSALTNNNEKSNSNKKLQNYICVLKKNTRLTLN